MGLIDTLKKIFGSNSAIESRFKSDLNQNSINSSDSNRDLNQQSAELQGLTDFAPEEEPGLFYQPLPNMISPNSQAPTPRPSETRPMQQPTMPPKRQLSSLPQMPALTEPIARQPTIELQKDSLELGMAAGYAGRSLKEIETSLNRIETFMASKEWFTNQFGPQLRTIYDSIHVHDENTVRKLEMIEFMIQSLEKTAKRVPEPLKTELLDQIETLEAQIRTPTRKMQKLVEIVKSRGELSYSELAAGLEISESALRGLLSNTVRRTKNITRVSKDGKGFVRYIGGEKADLNQTRTDSNHSQGDSSAAGF